MAKSKAIITEITASHRISFNIPNAKNIYHTVEYREVRDVKNLTPKEVSQEKELLLNSVYDQCYEEVQKVLEDYKK